MTLKRAAAYVQSLPAWSKFQHDTRFPRRAQDRLWRQILAELANGTYWPRRCGRSVATMALRDFEITTYEDYRSTIAADFASTRSSLSGREVLYWIESSGTTGGPKRFPLTAAHYSARVTFNRIYAIHLLTQNPNLLVRPTLLLSAPAKQQRSPAGIEVGYSSNYNARSLKSRSFNVLPAAVYRDEETLTQWGPLYAMAFDISHIVGMAPARIAAYLAQLADRLADYRPYLRGEKPVAADLPPLRIAPRRLDVIEQALTQSSFRMRDLWPSLRAVTTWKSGVCALQLPALDRYLSPEDLVLDYPYVASEGVFTLPDGRATGGPCASGLCITEFLKVGDPPCAAHLRPCWDLEPGQEYEIFLTSLMGLVRYRMFDRVRCTGYYNAVATIQFVGKTAGQLSFGTAVINEAEVVASLTHAPIAFEGRWMIGLRAGGDGLVVYHEAEDPSIRARAELLDRELRVRNPVYGWARSTGALVPIEAMHLPATHELWRAQPEHAQIKQRIFASAPAVARS